MSRDSDVSTLAPNVQRDSVAAAMHNRIWGAEAPNQARDVYFPVVDLDLDQCRQACVAVLSVPGADRFTVNSWRDGAFLDAHCGEIRIAATALENWENWILAVGQPKAVLGDCSFRIEAHPEVLEGAVEFTVPFLGLRWTGRVSIVAVEPVEGSEIISASFDVVDSQIRDPHPHALAQDLGMAHPTPGTSSDDLEQDLGLCLDFLEAAQNTTEGSPYKDGLYLFYDIDARTWRTQNWTWTWGPAIQVALEAPDVAPSLEHRRADLRSMAERLGELTLGVIVDDPGHPAHGMGVARWDPLPLVRGGSEKFASLADPLFLAGWAWGSLYDLTKDARYLAATEVLADTARRHIDEYGVVQQDWLFGRHRWLERVLDEAGFGVEGLAELYRMTGDSSLLDLIRAYMDSLVDRLGRSDGLWNRFYYVEAEAPTQSENMTRGMGWAMEGLLAAFRATQDNKYLAQATAMAEHLLMAQREDGAWTFQFHRPVEEVGFSDKGTPLWSILFYRLHAETGDDRHLAAARAALAWCRARLRRDRNDEARGGIVGINAQSGIAYRPWFRQACTYSTSFTAQALIYELSLHKHGSIDANPTV